MGDPQAEFTHVPVLYQEVLAALQPRDGGRYVDGTLGLGGHAAGILTASALSGQLLGLDVDAQALTRATERLAAFAGRVHLRHSSYTELPMCLSELGWDEVDGILLDLGGSSLQFDNAERGFSFQQQGPLDMRFDPQSALTAADVINDWDEAELADVLFHYGEEHQARKLARAIVKARPLHNTTQLAELIAAVLGGKRGGVHPATRSFQALRIVVNGELQAIEHSLPQALAALRSGGRLAVISFHSLEDRLVKQFMRQESRDCICPPGQPSCTCGHQASLKEISRKPIRPSDAEVTSNPRSRSARLRVAEKL